MNINIYTTIKKCDKKYGMWCGYLRPDEVVELVNRNLIEIHTSYKLEWAKEDVKKGKCNPTWTYFTPKGRFEEYHRGMKRIDK